jgi:hypothetical protein
LRSLSSADSPQVFLKLVVGVCQAAAFENV